MDPHNKYMQRCTELATLAAAEGESPVGSLIVRDGIILGNSNIRLHLRGCHDCGWRP